MARLQSRKKALRQGQPQFSERVFQKLLLKFHLVVERKDTEGRNVFQGGFLGLDNIGVFDQSRASSHWGSYRAIRRHQLDGDVLPQHASYCPRVRQGKPRLPENVASKFFEHFVYIARAMNDIGGEGIELWDAKDGFSTTSYISLRVTHY